MTLSSRREGLTLFFGDILISVFSLWAALALRYGGALDRYVWGLHVVPFSILILVGTVVFFIAGLYEKHTLILKSKIPYTVLNAQLANAFIAVLFFYLIPASVITPKTNLFSYLIISTGLLVLWRIYGVSYLTGKKGKKTALIIGSGDEMSELSSEINGNDRYDIKFVGDIDLSKDGNIDFQRDVVERIYSEGISLVVLDLSDEKVKPFIPHLYNFIFSKVRFIDIHRLYEEIFDRVPLSLLRYTWFMENLSSTEKKYYDGAKRVMDMAVSLVLGVITLPFYVFVALAIKIEDGGPVFIVQDRVGQNNGIMKLFKFRSMTGSDNGKWHTGPNDIRHTSVGKFLRKSRIDELPQLWNVFRGDISLIGPRPDIYDLGIKLAKEIPYYTVRNIVKPGLSGWAQINQDIQPKSVEETRLRLAYDLYYVKNRSFLLDIKIALRTVKTLLSRGGM
ncbi:MAG: exopolysaccharide biosynthesis polyprenyl glycosylphosphotransferase [Minisyncoccia bacterium]